MTQSRFVLAFYRSEEHAEEALREAWKKHFWRSAIIHRTQDGRPKFVEGLGSVRRATLRIGFTLSLALLAGFFGADWRAVALFGALGFLVVWLAFLWVGVGLPKKVLREYARFVLPGEGLLVIEVTEGRTIDVIGVLQSIGNPSVFVIRSGLRLAPSIQTDNPAREPVSLADLPTAAATLAASHQLALSTKSRSILPILRNCDSAIERARADLADATRLDYGITHAAEWLLDNAYLIRSHIAEIRQNLPDNHNKILPVLADTNQLVRLRVYQIADELICRTGVRVTSEGVRAFLDGYQSKTPLTIAELWVFPLMLRLVLLQKLQALSELTSLRQHQKKLANF